MCVCVCVFCDRGSKNHPHRYLSEITHADSCYMDSLSVGRVCAVRLGERRKGGGCEQRKRDVNGSMGIE